jgi:hypothetical protein
MAIGGAVAPRQATQNGVTTPLDELTAAVEQHGWLVVSAPLGDGLPVATSTVGLTARGLPELAVVGLAHDTGGSLLHEVATRLVAGAPIGDGEPVAGLVDVGADPCLDEPVRPEVLLPAADLYGDAVVVRQLVWPDTQGRLPGDDGFAHADLQPLVPGQPVTPATPVDDELPREWPLPHDPHTLVRTSRPAAQDGLPVLMAYREAGGGWVFLDGLSDFAEDLAEQECLHDALERDLSLIEVAARLEPGDMAERDAPGTTWHYGRW